MPEFSIIIPVYNVERYLGRCIDSVLRQSHADFELILIDDGSTDSCTEICDKYAKIDSRVIVIHQENQGVSCARNRGLSISKGKYIVFVDSDDTIDENYLYHMGMIDEDVDLVMCGVNHVYSNGKIENRLHYEKEMILEIKEHHVLEMIKKNSINSIFDKRFKKLRIEQIGLCYDCSMNLGEDTYFVVQYLKECKKVQYIDKDLYNYHKYEHNTLSAFDATYAFRLNEANQKIANVLSEQYNCIAQSTIWNQRCFDVFHYSIFEILRESQYNLVEKFILLKKIYKIEKFRELSKQLDIYMSKDTRIVQMIISTKSVILILAFWELNLLKRELLQKIRKLKSNKNVSRFYEK